MWLANLRRVQIISLSIIAMCFSPQLQTRAENNIALYVSPTGNDANRGTDPNSAFRTLERAENEIARRKSGTVYLMDGIFHQTAPLVLRATISSQKWLAFKDAKPILDGDDRVDEAIRVNGGNAEIGGLTIRNFHNNGIAISGPGPVTVSHNIITDIRSTGWNQAAILAFIRAPNVTVTDNIICRVGYAGIEFAGPRTGDLMNPYIIRNRIFDSCKNKEDCGAILLNGRSDTVNGAVIKDNYILEYGPPKNSTKAIYLDDYTSEAKVTGNTIRGSGTYAIQIHGGRRNLISENDIEVASGSKAVLYQAIPDARGSDMTGNEISNNIFRGVPGAQDLLKLEGGGQLPKITGNLFDHLHSANITCARQ